MDGQSTGVCMQVRKLYKMLEDPSYSSVVRWGDEGDSFVVLENEKFTKSILPKHFKHSNFASFVRQLNKYDFHKAWEFKHPDFRANNKDSLDNIKRKAPAPRKPNSISEDQIPIQQMDLMNQQLVAQSQQLDQLSARYSELAVNHQMMLQEVLRVQKTVLNHEHVIHQVMTFLHSVDAKQRRDSKVLFNTSGDLGQQQQQSTLTPTSQTLIQQDEEPASPLQHATRLLNDMNADVQFNSTTLEQMSNMGPVNGPTMMSTPPLEQMPRAVKGPTSATSSTSMGYSRLNNELENVVYPTGGNVGIDPTYPEHLHNIPYTLPPKEVEQPDARKQFQEGRKKSTFADPGWVRSPRILLVEDDPTCRQIGGKFLYSFSCVIDTALDGLEAVNKMQEGVKYDLILMDIIMPNLDGVSACHLIRQFDRTPIVAMTSNIRSDDIQMYFQHGMDDVLPKPFTRKSLLEMLERHLLHLKKLSPGMEPPTSATTSGLQPTSAPPSIKDDVSPGQSPAGSYMTVQHPGYGIDQNGMQYNSPTTPLSAQRPPHRRHVSDMSGGAGEMNNYKRQRIYQQGNMGSGNLTAVAAFKVH
ncbi:putative stress response regulator hfs transcription [Phaeomoniella chlamydospora]|uniref:Transcription factor n=1 Tax=Phaeomoniella chlamydospora TaxID=158046 RepID=A0A0G2EXJ1_PHACM|nr:putative stress response regulator hfs transcription [Phaeomoniella chlamydospora]